MPKLVFKVSSDYQEVIRLRQECEKLEAQLKKMDVNKSPAAAKALETQLASARQQMMGLVTEAAKAGAVMERDFKNGIFNASQTVNNLSANITSQRSVIRQLQNELTLLKEKYRETVKSGGDTTGMSEQIKAQTTKLREQKDVLFGLTQQQAEARLSVKRLKDEYSAFKEEAGETVEANEKMSISLTKVLGIIGGVTALKGFVSELINVRGQFQQLGIAFSTMLKSKEKADKLMGELVDIAAKTPFDLQGVAQSAKQMIAYGSSAENVGDELVMLGNVAAGVGSQLGDLAYLYGTLRTQGRAYAVDIRQFAGRGIPIYEELAKVLGVTKDKVSELVKEGKVGFKEVEQAFKNMTSESGIYYNLMEEQSKSLTGQLSNLGDAWDSMLNEIGKNTQGIAASGISALKGLIENYETVGKVLLGLIATYGTYKTATLALWVIEQARARTLLTSVASTKALTAAQTALNVVMKANPYVLVATTLAGVVAAMWAFHDSATESEKAQDRLNKRQEEARKIAEEHKVKIDKLIDSSRDLSLSDLQRGQSLADLRQEYPKIFAQYDIESIKLADILKLKQQIAEEDARRAGEKKKQDFENLESEITYYENLLKSMSGQQGIDGYVKKLKELRAERDILLKEKGKGISEQFISSLKEIDISEFDRYISELEKRIKGKGENAKVKMRLPIDVKGSLSDEALFEVKDIKTLIDTVKSTRQSRIEAPQKQTTYQEDLAKAKLDWETAKKGYQSLIKDQNATTEQVKKAREEMEAKEKAYKELGGTTEIKSTDKDKQKQEQEKLYDQLLQLRFKNQQDEINLMKEGADKKRKQIELDYQKEYAEIQKLEKEWGVKNGGKLTQEQFIEISRRYTNAKEKKDKSLYDIDIDSLKAEKDALNTYLQEYGTYQEKRAAIAAEYSKKIIQAETEGERMSLQKQYKKNINDLNFEEMKSGIDFSKVFGNIDIQSTESLKALQDKLYEYINGAAKNLSPENLKELQDAFKDIDAELLQRNPFEGLKQRVEAMQQAAQELEKAKDILERVQNGEQVVDTYRTVTDAQGNTKIQKTYLTAEKALKNYNKAKEKSEETSRDMNKAEKMAKQQVDELVTSIKGIGSTIGGEAGEIINLIGDITSFTTSAIDGISAVMQTGANAMSAMEKASVILGIISTAAQIFQSIGDMFGGDTGTSDYEVMIEKYQTLSSLWDDLISKKMEYISIDYGDEASKAAEEAKKLLESQILLARQAMEEAANEKGNYEDWLTGYGKLNTGLKVYNKINNTGINSIDELVQASPEKMKELLQDTQFVELIASNNTELLKYMQTLAGYSDQLDEIAEKETSAVVGVSFSDFKNSYVDLLTDLDSTNEDFANNFEQHLQEALFRSLMANKYDAEIQKLYDKWVELGKDGLTKEEMDQLKAMEEQLSQQMIQERENMKNTFGWTNETEKEQQSASSRGFGAEMTHEDAGELSGRFTAVYESNLRIETATQQHTVAITELRGSISALTSQVSGMYNIADETRTILANSYLELQQIRENTGEIIKPIKQIQVDIAEVKQNTSRL